MINAEWNPFVNKRIDLLGKRLQITDLVISIKAPRYICLVLNDAAGPDKVFNGIILYSEYIETTDLYKVGMYRYFDKGEFKLLEEKLVISNDTDNS